MMDITPLYKAYVKTLKTRNKALGLIEKDKSLTFGRSSKSKTEFTVKVKELLLTITKMRDFLLEHRKGYINSDHLLYGASNMTDSERDKIDSDAQAFIHTCLDVIKKLNNEVQSCPDSQVKEHQGAVISLIDGYLKAVCKIYSGQKAIRVKRTFDKQKMLRLDNDISRRKSFAEDSIAENSEKSPSKRNSLVLNDFGEIDPMPVDLSPEEFQMFEEENKRLYEEMNTLVDEVREIEGKVVEIGRLQEILSDKVLQQDQDINRIQDTIIGTTENIKEGNEDLRQAIRKKASLRIWILFILVVLSFSLLFLDWYSP